MRILLNKDLMVSNFLRVPYGERRTFILNTVDEVFSSSGKSISVKGCNLVIREELSDGRSVDFICQNIIGMANRLVSLETEHSELLGQPLTLENMDKCLVVLYE